jgi:hypothetical protein
MLSISTRAAIRSAAATHPDPTLRSLLVLRMGQLAPIEDGPSIRFIVFEAGDALDVLEADLGFTPLEVVPSWEWIEAHPGWFELAYVFTDDGDGAILFVSRAEGVAPDLLAVCNRWSVA